MNSNHLSIAITIPYSITAQFACVLCNKLRREFKTEFVHIVYGEEWKILISQLSLTWVVEDIIANLTRTKHLMDNLQ